MYVIDGWAGRNNILFSQKRDYGKKKDLFFQNVGA